MRVMLSPDEKDYLARLAGPAKLTFDEAPGGKQFVLDIDADLADDLRDRSAEELQLHGFDEEYKPTKEGKILESLVDKLFTG